MREFSSIAKTDEPARDAERKQVGAAVLTVIRAFDFTTDVCGVTRTKVHQGRTGPHQASINRINSRSRTGYMDVSNMEVSTAAGNYLAGNTFRESQPDMMRFFSTHIGAEEFDPTEDIKPQLCSLEQTQPGPHLNQDQLLAAINVHMERARSSDRKIKCAVNATANNAEGLAKFVLQFGRCAITACHMSPSPRLFSTMSLDAIVPGQPHSVDNIQWVCRRVNLAKNAFPDSQFRAWAKEAFTWCGEATSIQDCNPMSNEEESLL
jgi:hypothetical protein